MSHEIHKSNSSNLISSSRNAAFQACQACYARKKRCVTSPSHHQCTYCFREGQSCVPRERPSRTPQIGIPEKASEQSRPTFDLPLPHGIDHEVPRWSAMYWMFSEALRLIPPEVDRVQNSRKRTRDASVEGDRSDEPKKSFPTSDEMIHAGTKQIRDVKDELIPSFHEEEASKSSFSDALSSVKFHTVGEDGTLIPRHSGGGLSFGELDALLRF